MALMTNKQGRMTLIYIACPKIIKIILVGKMKIKILKEITTFVD